MNLHNSALQTLGKGAPVLDSAPAAVECKVTEVAELGCHHIVVGEVINDIQNKDIDGRPDHAILHMNDLGEKVFYVG